MGTRLTQETARRSMGNLWYAARGPAAQVDPRCKHRALGELETAGIQLDGQVHRTEDCLPNGSWHQQYVKMATRFLDQSWFTGNRVEAFWKLTSVD